MEKIILASGSPRRRELIRNITENFEVIVSDVEETLPEGISHEDAPMYLATLKAEDVSAAHPGRVVIGADTVVLLDDKILGKPKDADDAFLMLSMLSGRQHEVITGCCITDGERKMTFSERTLVEFHRLSEDEIRAYIATGEPFDKAGVYGIQGKSMLFVKRIDGDFFNVMGLPVAALYRKLNEFEEKN